MSRRTFAVSVVVTISLADLGCTTSGGNETGTPPPDAAAKTPIDKPPIKEPPAGNPPDPITKAPLDKPPIKDPPAGNPPDPVKADGGLDGDILDLPRPRERIVKLADGTCEKIVDEHCDPGDSCNPPPPELVPCPLPSAVDPKHVTQRGKECWESFDYKCAPDTKCNPPEPRQVQCPDTTAVPG